MASSNRTFKDVENEINSREIMPSREPSLEPTQRALEALGIKGNIDPEKVIVVAGTNGKGSTAKTLEVLLRNAGVRTGFYSSPHLVSIRERIQIEGMNISETEFVESYQYLKNKVDIARLSHFEILTLMAAIRFHAMPESVDYAIYEVGMGGTWDATNAIPHKNCVIARIGKDHEHLLGPGIESIARNKFGIISEGCRVTHLPLQSELLHLKKEIERATNTVWIEAEILKGSVDSKDLSTKIEFEGISQPLSLCGTTAIENTSLALKTFSELGFDPGECLSSLATVDWPGRLQRLQNPYGECAILFSGDHNAQGIESLLGNLSETSFNNYHFLVSVGSRKSVNEILGLLSSFKSSKLYLTTANFMGRKRKEYGEWIDTAQTYNSDPLEIFRELAASLPKSDILVVTGSLYLVGDLFASVEKPK